MSDKKPEIKNKMETCNCMIHLAGNVKNSIRRVGITVPEVMILNVIHGANAVQDIVQEETISRHPIEEKARLAARYNRPVKKPVDETFPGASPTMPTTFKDAGIEVALAPAKPLLKGNIVPVIAGEPQLTTDKDRKEIKAEGVDGREVIS